MKIAFLIDSKPSIEQISAFKWARARFGCVYKVEIEKLHLEKLDGFNIIWWHYDKDLRLPNLVKDEKFKSHIKNFLKNGNGLLLTLSAVKLLNEIEIEPIEPDLEEFWICEDERYNIYGFASFFGHPIFKKLNNAVWTDHLSQGEKSLKIAYHKKTPQKLRVIAVERSELGIETDKKILLEYEEEGRAICIGGDVFFSRKDNRFHHNLDRLILNSILYLNNPSKFSEPKTYWDFSKGVQWINLNIENNSLRGAQKKIARKSSNFSTETEICYVQGKSIIAEVSRQEISEIKILPFKLIDEIKFYVEKKGEVLTPKNVSLYFKPECAFKEIEFESVKIKALIFPHPKKPILVFHHLSTSDEEMEICFDFKISPEILSQTPIKVEKFSFGFEERLKAFFVNNDELFSILIGSAKRPAEFNFVFENDLLLSVKYKIPAGFEKAFNIAIAGEVKQPYSSEKTIHTAKEFYKLALRSTHKVFKENFKTIRNTVRGRLQISTPDDKFERNFNFAVALLNRFEKRIKNLGYCFVPNPKYNFVKVDEILKSLPALLKVGEYEILRDTLEFIGRFLSVRGELPTMFYFSGIFEYNDEIKNNYIEIAGDYVRATKDKVFAKFTWRRIKKFFDFESDTEKISDKAINSLLFLADVNNDEKAIEKLKGLKQKNEVEDRKPRNLNLNSGLELAGFIEQAITERFNFEVDAFDKKLFFSPIINTWNFFEIRNLRLKNMRIDISMRRSGNMISFHFEKRDVPEVKVIFEPRFERYIKIDKVLINGKIWDNAVFENKSLRVEFDFRFKAEVDIYFKEL